MMKLVPLWEKEESFLSVPCEEAQMVATANQEGGPHQELNMSAP
jgi:hypothetical protein